MIQILSNRVITFEQAKKVTGLFTHEDYASGKVQIYLVDTPNVILQEYDADLDAFLEMVDLPVYAAPTWKQLQERMIQRGVWLCDVISNEDRTVHTLGYKLFRWSEDFKHIRDIMPADYIDSNIELYALAKEVLSQDTLF